MKRACKAVNISGRKQAGLMTGLRLLRAGRQRAVRKARRDPDTSRDTAGTRPSHLTSQASYSVLPVRLS